MQFEFLFYELSIFQELYINNLIHKSFQVCARKFARNCS